MVKGISRRVVIVKAPNPRLFEQAIFIVREEALTAGGVTAEQVLAEAQRVADGYVRRNTVWGKRLSRIPAPAFLLLGALLASLCWALAAFML